MATRDDLPESGFRVSKIHESTHVVLSGDLDLVAVRELRAQLDAVVDTNPAELVLDLGGVEFLDSSGVAMLLRVRAEIGGRGGSVRLAPVSPAALRTLELCGLTQAFNVQD